MSQITIRLKEKHDKKGDKGDSDNVIAQLKGNTIDVLRRCLVSRARTMQGKAR